MTARVLVVDDIEANVKLLEARLTAEYFEVLTVSEQGPERSNSAPREGADVVLLDVMMPGMDGFEVCRRTEEPIPSATHMSDHHGDGPRSALATRFKDWRPAPMIS